MIDEAVVNQDYKYGFVTDVDADTIPRGLNEDIVRTISAKKNEPQWLLDWRLKAYHQWVKMEKKEGAPKWANIHYPPINYQDIIYYAAPKDMADRPKSLDEVDPEVLKTYEKLGIPLKEQEMLVGVAVDAVFDSVSVATTFKRKAGRDGGPLLLILRGGSAVPRPREEISRVSRALHGQLLCHTELCGLQRWIVLLYSQGREMSHGAFHVFSN